VYDTYYHLKCTAFFGIWDLFFLEFDASYACIERIHLKCPGTYFINATRMYKEKIATRDDVLLFNLQGSLQNKLKIKKKASLKTH